MMSYKVLDVGLEGMFADPDQFGFGIRWSVSGYGTGQFDFRYWGNEWRIANEFMSKDFIKAVLCAMVDQAKLDDKEIEQ